MTHIVQVLKEKLNGYTVENFQHVAGSDPPSWTASLYKGATEVLIAVNNSLGGPLTITPVNEPLATEFTTLAKIKNPDNSFNPVECFVDEIIGAYQLLKPFIAKCKETTLVVTSDCYDDDYLEYMRVYSSELARLIVRNHGSKFQLIINEIL